MSLSKLNFYVLKLKRVKRLYLFPMPGTRASVIPGFSIVRECRRKGYSVSPVPGPNAAITALAASGLPTHHFLFLGFPPKGRVAFGKLLEKWQQFEGSLIFYQSKYKMPFTFEVLEQIYGINRYMCVAREITKARKFYCWHNFRSKRKIHAN